jgi:hypothetical protein
VTLRRAAPVCAVLALVAGCDPALPPPPPRAPSSAAAVSAPAAPPVLPPAPLPPPLPSPLPSRAGPSSSSGLPEASAVSCAGRPALSQVVALVRSQGMLDATTSAKATLGPVCAGTWQYTILSVPQREPLQVVSQGPADALVLVTAGTDVCTDAVRAQAPLGILSAAHC